MKSHRPTWRQNLDSSLTQVGQLSLPDRAGRRLESVTKIFPLLIPPEMLALADLNDPRCPVRRQVVPDIRELDDRGVADPLQEEDHWVTPGIVQRFQDRLLALVSSRCPIHCRHCNRKRYWKGYQPVAGPEELKGALRMRPKVREVILSGGDPLMLSDRRLDCLLHVAGSSPNIELVRIHSRIPCSLPARITPGLIRVLKRHQPLWLCVQFNHAKELGTPQRNALLRLRNAGIPTLNQAVLLRGINDSVPAQVKLGRALLHAGAKPHYLFQLDRASGTLHFQVALQKARMIMHRLRSKYSGLLVPHFLVDLPGPHGKVPAGPDAMIKKVNHGVWLRAPDGSRVFYPEISI